MYTISAQVWYVYYDLACNSLWVCPEPVACELFSIIFAILAQFFCFVCTVYIAHEHRTPRTQKTSETASLGVLCVDTYREKLVRSDLE
jgi:hypothetical protein